MLLFIIFTLYIATASTQVNTSLIPSTVPTTTSMRQEAEIIGAGTNGTPQMSTIPSSNEVNNSTIAVLKGHENDLCSNLTWRQPIMRKIACLQLHLIKNVAELSTGSKLSLIFILSTLAWLGSAIMLSAIVYPMVQWSNSRFEHLGGNNVEGT
ncbi:hypothetical protein ACOME3_006866 [Neoechinorhynchus agilis]